SSQWRSFQNDRSSSIVTPTRSTAGTPERAPPSTLAVTDTLPAIRPPRILIPEAIPVPNMKPGVFGSVKYLRLPPMLSPVKELPLIRTAPRTLIPWHARLPEHAVSETEISWPTKTLGPAASPSALSCSFAPITRLGEVSLVIVRVLLTNQFNSDVP